MKKRLVPLVIVITCAFIVIGCSTASPTPITPNVPASTTPISQPSTTLPTTSAPNPSKPASSTQVATASSPSSKPVPTGQAKYGGTLTVIDSAPPGSPIGWPPEIAGGAGNTSLMCFEDLLYEDWQGNILPSLAESYEVNTDPKNPSITFHLRKGVKFQDGAPFNAQAVKWNLEMIKPGMNPASTRYWKSYDVLDDYTVRVNLTGWTNIIVRNFTGMSTLMSSPAAYQKYGVEWSRWNMVSTGAFKQVEFVKDVRLKLTKFDDYWDQGKPYLANVNREYVADELTRIAYFKTGGGDIMSVSPLVANQLSRDYTISSSPVGANMLIPDSANPDSPWSNAKVRMAAEYAIDKEGLSKALGYGYEPASYQIALPGNPAFVSNLPGRKYDVAKAKQLLAEAGYPNGFKTTIIRSSALPRDVAVAVQAYLAAVGIKADIDFADAARFATIITGTWNNALLFHQTRPFPNFNAELALEFGLPTTFYKPLKKPDGWEKIFNDSLNSPKPDPVLMQKASQALYDEATVIPTTYYARAYAVQSYVHDAGINQGGNSEFTLMKAWLSK